MREAGGCSGLEMPGKGTFSEIKVHVGAREARWLDASVRPRAGPELPEVTVQYSDMSPWVSYKGSFLRKQWPPNLLAEGPCIGDPKSRNL